MCIWDYNLLVRFSVNDWSGLLGAGRSCGDECSKPMGCRSIWQHRIGQVVTTKRRHDKLLITNYYWKISSRWLKLANNTHNFRKELPRIPSKSAWYREITRSFALLHNKKHTKKAWLEKVECYRTIPKIAWLEKLRKCKK